MCIRDRGRIDVDVDQREMRVGAVEVLVDQAGGDDQASAGTVSYTHLTLPTIYSV